MNSVEKEAVLHCLKVMIDEAVCEECPLYGTTGTDHCEKDCVRLAINALSSSENPNKSEIPTGWIPVSERLPEWHWETAGSEKFWVGEKVLACVKEADEYYDLVGVATYGPYGWESSDEGFCSCYASKPVIAWMPLPEPYKASPTGEEVE